MYPHKIKLSFQFVEFDCSFQTAAATAGMCLEEQGPLFLLVLGSPLVLGRAPQNEGHC